MDLVERAARLREERVPHVLATVVRARTPSSGKPGDRAIVTADRRVEGWVGGACAESLVADEALEALSAGRARYLVLDAEATEVTSEDDRVTHPLRCHSGGAIELFIEPYTPPLTVVVVGSSPVARTFAELSDVAGFAVTRTDDPAAAGSGAYVVVATMGNADEVAVQAALAAGAPYVAVVASRRRAAALRDWLVEQGVEPDALERLHAPAGLDIGARGAEGVAVSILAEVVAERDRRPPQPLAAAAEPQPVTRDPVCGMTADPAGPLTVAHEGRTYAFCGVGCREAFIADPSRYAGAPET